MNETNITTYTIKQQILRATVVTSYMILLNLLVNTIFIQFKFYLYYVQIPHTHIHTHTTKYLHCYKIYKCNNYEYNKQVQYMLQNSRNIFTNRRINNNTLVIQVIQKSWAHYTQLSWVVRCTKIGLLQQVLFY